MKRLVFSVLLCTAPAAAFAQLYAQAEVGYASADLNLGSPYNGDVDDRSLSYGADVGFAFRRRMALEFGVNRFGGFDGRATPCAAGAVCPLIVVPTGGNDITIYKLALVPHIELSAVELFAALGWYRAKIDTDIGLAPDDFTEDGVLLGVGARWYFSGPWSVSLTAERYDDKLYQAAVGFGWGLRPNRVRARGDGRGADPADIDDDFERRGNPFGADPE